MISDASIPFACSLASALGARGWSVTLLSEVESPSSGSEEAGAAKKGSKGKEKSESNPPAEKLSPAIGEQPSVTALSWNRPSALSARTVCIALRTQHRELGDAVIVFDTRAISRATDFSAGAELGAAADRYIRGVMLLAFETASLFFKQGRGRITFAVRESPVETGNSPAAAGSTSGSSSGNARYAESGHAESAGSFSLSGQSVASVARAAFVALAEEISASFSASGNPELKAFLVKLDPTDDVMNLDWLASRLTGESSPRSQGSWVKAGSRGIFGII